MYYSLDYRVAFCRSENILFDKEHSYNQSDVFDLCIP